MNIYLQLYIVITFLCYKVFNNMGCSCMLCWIIISCCYLQFMIYIASAFTYILIILRTFCLPYALCCIIIILVFTVSVWSVFGDSNKLW